MSLTVFWLKPCSVESTLKEGVATMGSAAATKADNAKKTQLCSITGA